MRKEYTFEQMITLSATTIIHIAGSRNSIYSEREIEMAQALIAMGED